jgi:hypothetical protein
MERMNVKDKIFRGKTTDGSGLDDEEDPGGVNCKSPVRNRHRLGLPGKIKNPVERKIFSHSRKKLVQ